MYSQGTKNYIVLVFLTCYHTKIKFPSRLKTKKLNYFENQPCKVFKFLLAAERVSLVVGMGCW